MLTICLTRHNESSQQFCRFCLINWPFYIFLYSSPSTWTFARLVFRRTLVAIDLSMWRTVSTAVLCKILCPPSLLLWFRFCWTRDWCSSYLYCNVFFVQFVRWFFFCSTSSRTKSSTWLHSFFMSLSLSIVGSDMEVAINFISNTQEATVMQSSGNSALI